MKHWPPEPPKPSRRRDRTKLIEGFLIGILFALAVLFFAQLTIVPIGALQ